MKFSDQILAKIEPYHLLQHPYYQDWVAGKLTKDTLQNYAKNYYPHVKAFPLYISATHSNCADINKRQILLENLIDEEQGPKNHPELWMQFAQGLGLEREQVEQAEHCEATKKLIATFMQNARNSYAEGLASLYAYEYQVPEIAKTKIEGLQEFYGIDSEAALEFFKVHQSADVYHSQACKEQLDQLTDLEQELALSAAEKSAQKLWQFLDAMQAERSSKQDPRQVDKKLEQKLAHVH